MLDPFAGSGTTLITAEKAGRAARLIEYNRAYYDTIIRRFQAYVGKQARPASSGESFENIAAARAAALNASRAPMNDWKRNQTIRGGCKRRCLTNAC